MEKQDLIKYKYLIEKLETIGKYFDNLIKNNIYEDVSEKCNFLEDVINNIDLPKDIRYYAEHLNNTILDEYQVIGKGTGRFIFQSFE